jgi:small subunit ribosomal protein S6
METAYEAVFILETTLGDEQTRAIVDKYTGVITANGGIVDDTDRWDPRRLAYEIKGKREGIYYVVNFRSAAATRNELDRIFRISDDILRYIIVKQDKKADRYPSRIRVAEQERREREQAARAAANAAQQAQIVTDLSALNNEAVVNEGTPVDAEAPPTDAEDGE